MPQTYGTIKQLVQDYAARSNLGSFADFFMEAAQQRINRRLRIRHMEKSYLVALDADSKAAIPADFLQVKNFFVFKYSEALPADETTTLDLEASKITALRPVYVESEENVLVDWNRNRYNSLSSDFKLTRQGAEWLVKPANTDYPNLGGMYYARFPVMSSTSDTNWLTTYAPDLLLRGGCLEASIFIKKQDQIQYWEGKFNEALTEVGQEFNISEHAGSTLRQRIPGAA